MSEKQKPIYLQLRLPPEDYAAIKKLAEGNVRPLNGEILIAIREHCKKGKRQKELV